MSTSEWMVLCRRENRVSLAEIAPQLAGMKDAEIVSVEADEMEIEVNDSMTGNTAGVWVNVDDEEDVAEVVEQIAEEQHDRPDHAALAACDLRYLISWERQYGDETYNTTMTVASKISKAVKGFVYDDEEGTVMWSEAG